MVKEQLFWYHSKTKPSLPIRLTYINGAGRFYGFDRILSEREIQDNDLRDV